MCIVKSAIQIKLTWEYNSRSHDSCAITIKINSDNTNEYNTNLLVEENESSHLREENWHLTYKQKDLCF